MRKKIIFLTSVIGFIFLGLLSHLYIGSEIWDNYKNKKTVMNFFNAGSHSASLEIEAAKSVFLSYNPKLDRPAWAPELVSGIYAEVKMYSKFFRYTLNFKVHGDGELIWTLYDRSETPDEIQQENNEKILLEFKNISINGDLLDKHLIVSQNNTKEYRYPVKDKQKLVVSFEAKNYFSWMKVWQNFDGYLFIIAAIFSFLVAYKLVLYLAQFKISEHHSRIDIIFVSCFFICLFIPMSYISTDVQSKQENRMLAKYFHLFEDGVLNCDYGQQFEQWFNDRFFGRSFLIKKYNKLRNMIVQRGNENVLLGKDGWAFFIQNGGLENFKNISSFSETEMAATAAYLKTVDEWCKARGKEFYFIICPDKHRVYGEYMVGVSKVKPDNESRTIKLIEYLKEHTKVKVVYLQDTLLAAKDQAILYLKNDTHWTSLGAYYGYKRIMAELNKTNRFTVVPYDEITFIKNPKGDLNAFYPEMATDDTTEYPNAVVKSEAVCRDRKDGNVLDIVCVNPQGHQSLVVFRDSFTSALKPFLDKTFSKIEYIWRYDIRHKDFDTMNKADIIIIEVLERLLPSMTKIEFPKQ